jgi:hypothetical protein
VRGVVGAGGGRRGVWSYDMSTRPCARLAQRHRGREAQCVSPGRRLSEITMLLGEQEEGAGRAGGLSDRAAEAEAGAGRSNAPRRSTNRRF